MALAYNGLNARTCRRCGEEDSKVFDVRIRHDLVRRRRRCQKCGFVWATVEIEEFSYVDLVRQDEKRAFDEIQRRYEESITAARE